MTVLKHIACDLRLQRNVQIFGEIFLGENHFLCDTFALPNSVTMSRYPIIIAVGSTPRRPGERAPPGGRLQPLRQGQLGQHLQGRAQGRAPRHRQEPNRREDRESMDPLFSRDRLY